MSAKQEILDQIALEKIQVTEALNTLTATVATQTQTIADLNQTIITLQENSLTAADVTEIKTAVDDILP